MAEQLANLLGASGASGLKLASGADENARWVNAYNNSNSMIIMCIDYVDSASSVVTLTIMKDEVTSSPKRWYSGAYYNSTFAIFWQGDFSTSSASGIHLYKNGSELSNRTVNFYYD